MKPPAPARVKDIQAYWLYKPPGLSKRCQWIVNRIQNGWIPNNRILGQGYYGVSEYLGVYIWEWLNVISPLIDKVRK